MFLKSPYHVSKVGEQMHVGLRSTASTLHTEAALLSKFQQKQLYVMHCCLVGDVPLTSGLCQICVMPSKASSISGLSDAWAPKRKKSVAFGVGVLQQS